MLCNLLIVPPENLKQVATDAQLVIHYFNICVYTLYLPFLDNRLSGQECGDVIHTTTLGLQIEVRKEFCSMTITKFRCRYAF